MQFAKAALGGLVLAIVVLPVSGAVAQDFGFMSYYDPYGYGGGYGGGYGYGGGTVAGNYMNGMSSVIRSAGEYNLTSSVAGINNEEARSRYLDNKRKWQENYFQMQEQRQALDAQRRAAARHSPEALNAAAKSALPRALPPDALDPVTGRINWPELLLGSEFEKPRTEVEKLFELRTKTSQGAGSKAAIRKALDEMATLLRKQVEKLPANTYMDSRKFLDSLDYAARTNAL
jgi:hypothetical protein